MKQLPMRCPSSQQFPPVTSHTEIRVCLLAFLGDISMGERYVAPTGHTQVPTKTM